MKQKSKIDVSEKALKAINRLTLTAQNFFSEGGGEHASHKTGDTLDFHDRRYYEPGDDLRLIDWVAYARSEKLLIKRYDEKSMTNAYVLVDTSRSMALKSLSRSKLQNAQILGFCLANIIAGQFDNVSLVLFSNHIETYIPPQKSKKHVNQIATVLSNIKLRFPSDFNSAGNFARKISRKSIFIIISDFYDDLDTVLQSIKTFSSPHEVILFQVHDIAERDLSLSGNVLLEDLESNTRKKISVNQKIISEYKKRYQEFYDTIDESCKKLGVDLIPVYSEDNLDMILAEYLMWRQARKGMY